MLGSDTSHHIQWPYGGEGFDRRYLSRAIDPPGGGRAGEHSGRAGTAGEQRGAGDRSGYGGGAEVDGADQVVAADEGEDPGLGVQPAQGALAQIGRASCRERVWAPAAGGSEAKRR